MKRPSKTRILEIIDILEKEIVECTRIAHFHLGIVKNPINSNSDPAHFERSALREIKKGERLKQMVAWLNEVAGG